VFQAEASIKRSLAHEEHELSTSTGTDQLLELFPTLPSVGKNFCRKLPSSQHWNLCNESLQGTYREKQVDSFALVLGRCKVCNSLPVLRNALFLGTAYATRRSILLLFPRISPHVFYLRCLLHPDIGGHLIELSVQALTCLALGDFTRRAYL
jgi:hypothetical protein